MGMLSHKEATPPLQKSWLLARKENKKVLIYLYPCTLRLHSDMELIALVCLITSVPVTLQYLQC